LLSAIIKKVDKPLIYKGLSTFLSQKPCF
jgi:hypothetical protein